MNTCLFLVLYGFFILVDDHQVDNLEEKLTITPETQITFIKLVPLVGG